MAVPKEVVLVCSEERKSKFPFDVQHRSIITYKTESPQDFLQLKEKITNRIKAVLRKASEIDKATIISPVADTEGLSPHELVALVIIMQNSFISEDGVSAYKIKEDMNNAGFTDIAVSIALKILLQKGMIITSSKTDFHGNEWTVYNVTPVGDDWLLRNQHLLTLREEPKKHAIETYRT